LAVVCSRAMSRDALACSLAAPVISGAAGALFPTSVVLSLEPATLMPPHLVYHQIFAHRPPVKHAVRLAEAKAPRQVATPLVARGDDAQQQALAGFEERVLKDDGEETAPDDWGIHGHVRLYGVLRPAVVGDDAANPAGGIPGLDSASTHRQDAPRALLNPIERVALSGLHTH
jgi:hypothetical protein